MVHFSNLSLAGFKSFADGCEVDIKPGLTGIVGPNGCGKSNLVEALRWIMGENSAKRMRGTEMDDVIFAGTVTRPPRNHAEVRLVIDNRERSAPEIFNKDDTLEITRKIERGMGSEYRVNGRLVRARDIQMLFADTASGANSPAIVSQGRVSDIIHAKPTDRRRILEDAAAISGLNSRRAEAEQRLQAAERNLIQVDDVLAEKEKLYQNVRKQARQAMRYREISADLRKVEGALFFHEWQAGQDLYKSSKEKVYSTHELIESNKIKFFELKQIRDRLQKDATDAQALYIGFQNKQIALENERNNLAEQIAQIEAVREQTREQIAQIESDISHEKKQIAEAKEKLALLDEETKLLAQMDADFSESLKTAETERENSRRNVETLRENLNRLTTETAAQRQKSNELENRKNEAVRAVADLENRLSAVNAEIEELKKKLAGAESVDAIKQAVENAEKELEKAKEKSAEADNLKSSYASRVGEAHAKLQNNETIVTRLKTEASTIAALLQEDLITDYPPVLDSIKVEDGYEKAVSVALGRELKASLDDEAPTFWQKTSLSASSMSGFPKGLKHLSEFVTAPAELAIALSQIAVAETAEDAVKHVAELSVGQWIVTRAGDAWRWDGYTIRSGAAEDGQTQAAAIRLEQHNRLEKLSAELHKAEAEREKASAEYTGLIAQQQEAHKKQAESQAAVSECYKSLDTVRNNLSRTISAQADTNSKLNAAGERAEHFVHLIDERKKNLAAIADDISAQPSLENAAEKESLLRAELQEKSDIQRNAEERFAQINADFNRRAERTRAIGRENEEWAKRLNHSDERVSILTVRHTEAVLREESFADKPEELKTKLTAVNDTYHSLNAQEENVKKSWEEKNSVLKEHDTVLNDAEEAINMLREEKARAETAMQGATASLDQLAERARKQFGCELTEMAEKLELDDSVLETTKHTLEKRFDELLASRERLGAINLRADEDARILFEEIEKLTKEKEDILNAVGELRQAISKLNSDARRRLMLAFNEVNRHFEQIFTRLFGGGKAYLQLTNADDPLEAGLEIFASPPGKKLQNLSLLSGGEQGLTAIALIFAMFRTTPSPICILDEIDAPLDDANVTRICELLQDFTRECDTRFLIISHNAITMSHMHRLYGVTMGERGVSKLVSVDLQRHLDFMDNTSPVTEAA